MLRACVRRLFLQLGPTFGEIRCSRAGGLSAVGSAGGFVDFFGRRSGVVGDLSDHFVGVEVELDTFDVTDGGLEGAQDEFGAFEFDGAARQGEQLRSAGGIVGSGSGHTPDVTG